MKGCISTRGIRLKPASLNGMSNLAGKFRIVVKLAIFASGSGSNAEKIMEYFRDSEKVEVSLILSNKADAGVLERAQRFGVPTKVFDREEFYDKSTVLDLLHQEKVDWIILAGFLWLVPAKLVESFRGRIVNIHPALLPRFGGKGMYGARVHRAVKESGAKESGITIHFVDEHYDEGDVIFQTSFPISPEDTAESIETKVHRLEHEHFPRIIESLVTSSTHES